METSEEALIDILVNGTYNDNARPWGLNQEPTIGKSYLTNEMSLNFVFDGELHCVYSNLLYDEFERWMLDKIAATLADYVRTGKIKEYINLSKL